MIDEFDRYTFARRLFEEKKYAEAARELQGVLDSIDTPDTGDGPDTTVVEIPGTGEARLLLARAYYHSAQLHHAEAAARALLRADPTDTSAMMLLARTLDRSGRGEEGDRWRRRAEALGG